MHPPESPMEPLSTLSCLLLFYTYRRSGESPKPSHAMTVHSAALLVDDVALILKGHRQQSQEVLCFEATLSPKP